MKSILNEVKEERIRQNEKWGVQNHSPIEWVGILTEETGEVSKEAVDYHFANGIVSAKDFEDMGGDEMVTTQVVAGSTEAHALQLQRMADYRKELIQVAAVAIQAIECHDRNMIFFPECNDCRGDVKGDGTLCGPCSEKSTE